MRRRKAVIGEENEEIDLTPMLDVVFIMLIFFIVTATFVKEIGLDVNSPDKNQNVKDADKQSIVVQITNRDRIRIRGRDITSGRSEPISSVFTPRTRRPRSSSNLIRIAPQRR